MLQKTSESGHSLGVESAKIDQLIADVRRLAAALLEANAAALGAAADLERITNNLLSQVEKLPGRIADAIAKALAEQHRMIVTDVESALREFTARLETPPSKA